MTPAGWRQRDAACGKEYVHTASPHAYIPATLQRSDATQTSQPQPTGLSLDEIRRIVLDLIG
jgi:hypothetical protein